MLSLLRKYLFALRGVPNAKLRALVRESGFFDPAWYLEKYPDVAAAGLDALDHYVRFGAAELRDPHPYFNAVWYAKHHAADPRAAQNPLLHYITNVGSTEVPHFQRACLARELLSEIADLDPDFFGLKRALPTLAFVDGVRRDKAAAAWGKLFASLDRPYERMIFVPWLIRGGADLSAVKAASAAIEKHGAESLLFVVADSSRMEASDWLPERTHVRVFSEYDSSLSLNDRVELISWLVQALKPTSMLNVNSHACWELIKSQGAAIATFCDIYAMLFCREYNSDNEATGYADTHFRPTLPYLKGIYFDNRNFIDELANQFAVPPSFRSRLKVVYQPAAAAAQSEFALPIVGEQLPVMWAGRLCRQKHVELLVAIAKRDQRFRYEVFGSGEPHYEHLLSSTSNSIENLVLHGSFASFQALPTERFGAFLYTTLWDGLPNVLLAAGAAGLPIAAPSIGGISELVNEKTGWLVTDHRNPMAYLSALEEIRSDPEKASRRTLAMRDRIARFHTWSSYVEAMSKQPSFLD